MTVIARLDRAIQRKKLDSPVEPENDKQTKLCLHTNDRIIMFETLGGYYFLSAMHRLSSLK